MIDSSTRLYGLVGHPVAGSRSPWVHNFIFETFDIPAVYLSFNVESDKLQDAVNGFKAVGTKGFNVTIPYKTDIIPMLDRVDGTAMQLGAVNTVVYQDGDFIGYNTDGDGLIKVLERRLGPISNQRVLVLGAGGAARGICGSLMAGKAKAIGIWNRTEQKAHQLKLELETRDANECKVAVISAPALFSEYDLVINSTSVGMEPDIHESPIDVRFLSPQAVVCDIVYKPHQTQLLRDAALGGHDVIYGIEMLIEQGLLAQKLWNGLSDDALEPVRNALIREFEMLHK